MEQYSFEYFYIVIDPLEIVTFIVMKNEIEQ